MNTLLRAASVGLIIISILSFPVAATSKEGLSDRALLLLRKGEFRQVVTILAEPAKKDPGLSSLLGWAYLRLNDMDAAAIAFRRSITANPKQSEAYCGIGYVNLRQGRPADAIGSFENGLARNNSNLDCLGGLAVALEQMGEKDKAKRTAEAVLKKDRTNESAKEVLSRLASPSEQPTGETGQAGLDAHRKRDYASAVTLLKKAISEGNMKESLLMVLADSHYRLGNLTDAINIYRLMLSRGIAVERASAELANIYGINSAEVRSFRTPSMTLGKRPEKLQLAYKTNGDQFEYFDGRSWRRTYLVGVNIGPAPPGEFASTAPRDIAVYEKWFAQMASMKANMVRAYTILPPAFYMALKRHNERTQHPLWLLQEVWISEREDMLDLFNDERSSEFREEAHRVVDVLHGHAEIPYRPGHAAGIFSADVSPYVFAIAPGREVEPSIVLTTNKRNPEKTFYNGSFIQVKKGNPSEVWFASMLDDVASYEMDRYNAQRPLTIVNWPPLDPMYHVTEANYAEERKRLGEIVKLKPGQEMNDCDAVSLDVTNLSVTPAFQAGLFASYHVYTYWPDFLMYDPEYPKVRDSIGSNRYLGYLLDLKRHHQGMPLLIAEYGVPSSWGIAHVHPDGWHNGGFTEKAQAELLERMTWNIKDSGCAGGIVFAWIDEWWKSVADNFIRPFDQPPDRRPLWQNMLNPEENFGIIGYLPAEDVPLLRGVEKDWNNAATVMAVTAGKEGRLRRIMAMADSAYLYIRLDLGGAAKQVDWAKEAFWVALSTMPNQAGSRKLPNPGPRIAEGATFLLKFSNAHQADLLIAENFNPNQWIRNADLPGSQLIQRKKELKLDLKESALFEEMVTQANPPRWGRDGTVFQPQFANRSKLRAGTADRSSTQFTSHAAWNINDTGTMIEIRIPWGLLYIADPSSHLFYSGTDSNSEPLFTKGDAISMVAMHLAVSQTESRLLESLPKVNGNRIDEPLPFFRWNGWNMVQVKPYFKPAYYSLQKAFQKILEEFK